MKASPFLFLLILIAGCSSSNNSMMEARAKERMNSLDLESQQQITSLITMIDEQERVTDPGAKRSIPYEFRIPLDSRKKSEVHRIDPSVRFTPRTDSYQCIGDSATKENVYRIVALSYTYRIKFCPFE